MLYDISMLLRNVFKICLCYKCTVAENRSPGINRVMPHMKCTPPPPPLRQPLYCHLYQFTVHSPTISLLTHSAGIMVDVIRNDSCVTPFHGETQPTLNLRESLIKASNRRVAPYIRIPNQTVTQENKTRRTYLNGYTDQKEVVLINNLEQW